MPHPNHPGEHFERDGLGVVLVDVFLDLLDPVAAGVVGGVRERAAGQDLIVGSRELVQELQAVDELPEGVLVRGERVQPVVGLQNGVCREGNPVRGLFQHLFDAGVHALMTRKISKKYSAFL